MKKIKLQLLYFLKIKTKGNSILAKKDLYEDQILGELMNKKKTGESVSVEDVFKLLKKNC